MRVTGFLRLSYPASTTAGRFLPAVSRRPPPPGGGGGVEIRAGFPPEPAKNLSCQTNLSTSITMTCRWIPAQQDTHLRTEYSLNTMIWDSTKYHTYRLPADVGHYVIPRPDFVLFSEMEIYVKAVNELGETASAPLTLEPMSVAKFDPPNIVKVVAVPKRLGCLQLHWTLSPDQSWMQIHRFILEVQIWTTDSGQQGERTILPRKASPTRPLDLCRLFHGTLYFFRLRVQYKRSTPWSEWSSRRSGITLETAPTGRLDTWTKLSEDHVQKLYLFWKPSKQFRANSQNVSYVVSAQKLTKKKLKLCHTLGNYCSFLLPGKAKKIYLQAVNAAGKSLPTEILILQQKVADSAVSDLTVTPQDNAGFLVRWKTTDASDLTGHVVEWRPLLPGDLSSTQFETVDANQSSLVIAGGAEPYKPYGISVYPRFKDGIGFPQTLKAYSRQKAPLVVPKINIKKWRSQVKLSWEEIPLEQRNGIIQNYKVFYWEEEGPVNVVNADVEERKVTLEHLKTSTVYKAFMMVSTSGGSRNGSTITFEVEPFDPVTMVMSVTAALFSFLLMVIFLVNCFYDHKRLKCGFCPDVPDPANSSIKRWTSESSQYSYPSMDSDEPDPVFLEHLDLDVPLKAGKEETGVWTDVLEDTSDLGTSLCGSPFSLDDPASRSDSVPYATVVFSSPCDSPPPPQRHAYLHSESTQPLLENEEPFTPVCYQNTAPDGTLQQYFFGTEDSDVDDEEATEPASIWNDFPFLQALALYDAPNN
uniref:Colony stimulating factor 3 receptor n=1 Tax=Cynoglossus semilaevis TaxID=244447 RepID=A0A3P8WT50_CYNSE